jgi:hypothetical protein
VITLLAAAPAELVATREHETLTRILVNTGRDVRLDRAPSETLHDVRARRSTRSAVPPGFPLDRVAVIARSCDANRTCELDLK